MSRWVFRRASALAASLVVALLAAPASARVVKIVLQPSAPLTSKDTTIVPYETIVGHAFGELDPKDRLNAIIQDIDLAPRNANGKVEYEATFQIVKPVDLANASGLLWHDVPNRGGRITIVEAERKFGDIGISSGWQGDNQGGAGVGTLQTGTTNEWVKVPVAHNRNGSTITGTVLGRIVNRSGPGSQPIFVQANKFPYAPATLDTTKARLTTRQHETMTGQVVGETAIASTDWAWGKCDATTGFASGVTFDPTDPTQICVKGGFNPSLLYQVVFTAKDPLVLGIGFAAFRDVESFFKYETKDDFGTRNPLAPDPQHGFSGIRWSISRGVSQSGNFLRGWLHLGFNQDEARRQVSNGMWPIIAGRRIALNFRWAQPDGVLELYEAGSEGPQWWARYEDHVRNLPKRGILDRCSDSGTCPKIIEHFGSAEVWELKLPIEWVGTDAKFDIPIPANVRRYYIPSTTHGGGGGGFSVDTLPPAPNCPGNNYGTGALNGNPVPHTETVNAIRVHFRDWVMAGIAPPASLYPRLNRPVEHGDDGDDDRDDHPGQARLPPDLVPPTLDAMGFPRGLPKLRDLGPHVPEAATINGKDEVPFINPVLDYDWGPNFDFSDGSGVPTNFPPPIKQVIKMLVPRVDADGNEVGGVPVVLRDAPLGSYFGWNITAGGARPFHQSQNCDYTGGMIPFAKKKADRFDSAGNVVDPRLSLEERYGTHAGYVDAVRAAAKRAVEMGFLLQADADALIAQATLSTVLNP
jgi:Alpha/beta hydrolase domain